MSRYFNPEVETLSREKMREKQSEALVANVRRAYENVKAYREKMDAVGVQPEDIRSIDDLPKLPFTNKTDLRDAYPFGLFAVPMTDIVRIHASSGTTGKQTVVGYTRHDIDLWSDCVARALTAAGGTPDDFIHVSYGYGLFTGGLGLHYGVERLGATVIPAATGNTERQLNLIRDFGATMIACTPSYALYISDMLKAHDIPLESLKLKSGVFGGEPWTEEMRKQIEDRLHIKAFDIYGLSEISGPGVAFECEAQNGMHVNEDHFYIEIIDPVTGEVLPDGQQGEVVFSCITKEALPLLRYRTHDISSITHEKCSCGRTLVRMMKPTGRSDDMLIIRGVNVFPSQVESVLLSIGQVEPHYQIIVDRVNNHDTLEILVEINDSLFSDNVRGIEALEKLIKSKIESVLGLAAKITFVGPSAIERTTGKTNHVIDKRKSY